jgi:hypothetical protein
VPALPQWLILEGGLKAMKRFLSALYKYWMRFARVLGIIQTTIILFLIYVLLFGPARLFLLLAGKDLLDKRKKPLQSFWLEASLESSLERSYRQF